MNYENKIEVLRVMLDYANSNNADMVLLPEQKQALQTAIDALEAMSKPQPRQMTAEELAEIIAQAVYSRTSWTSTQTIKNVLTRILQVADVYKKEEK